MSPARDEGGAQKETSCSYCGLCPSEFQAARRRLPDRRASEIVGVECGGVPFTVTTSRFDDGGLAEIFIGTHKAGSHADACARDAAVVCSLALQYGVPLDVIRGALLRNADGSASTPLGVALDALADREAQR